MRVSFPVPNSRRCYIPAALLVTLVVGALVVGCTSAVPGSAVPAPVAPTANRVPGAPVGVGDCASLTGTDAAPVFRALPCPDPQARFEVALVLGSATASCPAGDDYTEYFERRGTGGFKVCLIPNLVMDRCYLVPPGATDDRAITPAPSCGAPGTFRVVEVLRGTSDERACGPGENGLAYRQPPVTFCIRPS